MHHHAYLVRAAAEVGVLLHAAVCRCAITEGPAVVEDRIAGICRAQGFKAMQVAAESRVAEGDRAIARPRYEYVAAILCDAAVVVGYAQANLVMAAGGECVVLRRVACRAAHGCAGCCSVAEGP